MDSALLRPGRFDRIVRTHHPATARAREDVFRVHLKRYRVDEAELNLRGVSEMREAEGMSAAEIANVVNEASFEAVKRQSKAIESRDVRSAVVKSFISRRKGQ